MHILRKILKWTLILFGGVLLLIAIGVGILFYETRPPSDETLIENFNHHQEGFEKIVKMLKVDKDLLRVDDNWTLPHDPTTIGITADRIAEYRGFFSVLHIPRGFSAYRSPDHFEFIAFSFGLVSGGESKGYLYQEQEPAPLVQNLGDSSKLKSGGEETYRRIKDNWYLFYERD